MPMPAEQLQQGAKPEDVKAAISGTIEMCMKEGGRDQKQCAAMAYEMARKSTGMKLMMGDMTK